MSILSALLTPYSGDSEARREARLEELRAYKLKEEQEKFLSDPSNVEKILSHWAHQSLPEVKAAKIALGAPLDKIERAIPEDDPRKGLAKSILLNSSNIIVSNPTEHPVVSLAKAYAEKLNEANKDNKLYKYIFEKEAALTGSGAAPTPGYEQYKKAVMEQHEKDTDFIRNPLPAMGFGALLQGGAELAGKLGWSGAARMAGRVLSVVPHPVARIAGVALMAVPTGFVEDVLSYPIRKSQWAAANPIKSILVQLGIGGGVYAGIEKGIGKGLATYAEKSKLFEKAGLDVMNEPSIANMSEYLDARGALFKKEYELERAAEKARAFRESMPGVEAPLGEAVAGVATPRAWGSSIDAVLYGTKDKVIDRTLQEADNRFIVDLVSKGVDPEEAVKRVKNFAFLREQGIADMAREAERQIAEKTRSAEFGRLFTERMKLNPDADPATIAKQIKEEQDIVQSLIGTDVKSVFENRAPSLTASTLASRANVIPKIESQLDDLEKQTRIYLNNGGFTRESVEEISNRLAIGNLDDQQALKALDDLELGKRQGLLTESEKVQYAQPILDGIKATKPNLLSDPRIMSHEWDVIVNHLTTEKVPNKNVIARAKELLDNPEFHKMMVRQDVKQIDRISNMLYGYNPLDETRLAMNRDLAAGMTPDQFFAKYGNLGKFLVGGAVAASVGILPPLSTPSEASIRIDPLAKYIGENISKSEMMKKIYDMGLHSPITSQYRVEKFQQSLNFVPELSFIARQHKLNPILNSIMSPGAKAQFYFKTGLSPEPILASKTIAAGNNTQAMLNVASNILENIPRQTDEIREFMKPLLGYQEKLAEYGALNEQKQLFDKILSGKYKTRESGGQTTEAASLSRRIKSGKLDEEDLAMIDDFTAQRDAIASKLDEYKDVISNYQTEWQKRVRVLAERYPSTRVFFASEGIGLDPADPWVAKYLTHEEAVAASRIKEMMQQQKQRSIEAGMDVIDSKDYMHYAFHPDSDLSRLDTIVKNVSLEHGGGIQMAKYHTRSKDALPLMPDAHYALQRYIPDSNMRIEMADFWREWEPFLEKARRAGYDGVADYLDRLKKAFAPADLSGGLNKWANRYQLYEVARLLSLSPSVGFKHGMKVLSNISLGGINAIKNIPEAAVAVKDLNVSNLLREQPANLRSDLLKAFIGGRNMYAIANDIVPYQVPLSAIDVGLGKFTENTNQIINTVEKLDRGISMLSSIEMAAKRGMTPGQAAYLVYDTILKANFMSGIHNPSWLRDPKVRALLLFQGTPFKIWEQRLITAYKGGLAIKEGLNTLYNKLKQDIKEGEIRMKYGIIKDAFAASRDVNGNSYAGQLMRMLLTLGTVGIGGKELLGVSFMDQILHPPFLKLHEQSASLAVNPIMSAALGTLMSKDDETNAFIEFLGKWLPNWGAPAIVNKVNRLTKQDIPEIYRDSKLQYFFGVPSWANED
mgnify:CR=1 FL=1